MLSIPVMLESSPVKCLAHSRCPINVYEMNEQQIDTTQGSLKVQLAHPALSTKL